jgi:uncharacterized SAM-dependent methyltransferase
MLAVQLDPSLLPQFALKTPSPSSPRFIDLGTTQSTAAGDVQLELTHGLVAESARVAPKFFYDALGCRLFEAITELDEYYPTRTEAGIFQAWQTQMAAAIASSGIRHACLIDLGAGNCVKAEALIPQLLPRQYVPVDISNDFLCMPMTGCFSTQVRVWATSHPCKAWRFCSR